MNALSISRAVLFAVAVACCAATPRPCRAAEHTKDPLDAVKKKIADKSAILVDVREKSEWWDEGHLSGARLVPLSDLKKGIAADELARKLRLKDKGIVLYLHCGSGVRSLTATDILKNGGYDARALKQGY